MRGFTCGQYVGGLRELTLLILDRNKEIEITQLQIISWGTTMKAKCSAILFALFSLVMVSAQTMHAQIDYAFSPESGSRITGSFTNLNFNWTDGSQWGNQSVQQTVNIGFDFKFDGTVYNSVVVHHSGVIALGTDGLGSATNNNLRSLNRPVIAALWDDMRVTDNLQWQETGCDASSIRAMTTGSAPNRIFVVDWDQLGLTQGGQGFRPAATFQIRLYEGTNKIEFYYEDIDGSSDGCSQWGSGSVTTSATIGIGSSRGFLSVTPDGDNSTASEASSNNSINLSSSPLSEGTVFTFCPAGLTGYVDQGGTTRMANGDTLLVGQQVVLSSSQPFQPFALVSICASNFTYAISGPGAADYSISPGNGSLPEEGNTPTLTFSPKDIGIRYAVLTVRDNLGYVNRTYILAGEGIPRTMWIGNIAEGGTAQVQNGDTLMKDIFVRNGNSETFEPLTLLVQGTDGPNAPFTYELIDPLGQFSINKTSESVAPGSTSTLLITFNPTGVGRQPARLIVNAEGEVRSYVLYPFARGAGARFFVDGQPFGAGSAVFRSEYGCVAEDIATQAVVVESIGDEPFEIQSNDAYQTDNKIGPGTPPFPLLRDQFGNLVPVEDYFISNAPGSRTPLELPIVIPPGERRTIYLNFLPKRPGKRQARAFFQTNGVNFFGLDTDNQSEQGLLNFEFVGTGLGSSLSNAEGDGFPKALVFEATEVRSTSTIEGYLYNAGECDLRISSEDFRLVSGDVDDFKIITPLKSPKDGQGNYVIPAGGRDTLAISFTPVRSGSRRASIRVVTNDSALYFDGFAERGVYYLDVFGIGKVGLEARKVVLPPAVIGGDPSRGVAVVENTSTEIVTITGITVIDANGEIIEDSSEPWPALPLRVEPGEHQRLGLEFTAPAGSAPGARAAVMEVTLSNGDVLVIDISSVAGTRELFVAPTSLFTGMQLPVGSISRQFVAVTNQGTFPVTIQSMQLTESVPGDYKASDLQRHTLEPGQIEFVEVTYSPQTVGMSSGTLEFVSNAANGPHIVTLGGEGTSTSLGDPQDGAVPAVRPNHMGAQMMDGTTLWQSTPNPASSGAEIRFYMPEEGAVEMNLYDSQGRLVQNLTAGVQTEGQHTVPVMLDNVASGRYFYTLRTSAGALTLALDVVK